MKTLAACAPLLSLVMGCASVINDVTHPMRVETMTATGEAVAGAECKLTNDYAALPMKSGDIANVRRSNKDLEIVCIHPANPEAVARAISRVNGGMFGNILLGGGIGAIIDHNRGTAYTYPTWIQLVFGNTLVFDRWTEKAGQPVSAAEPAPAASVPAK